MQTRNVMYHALNTSTLHNERLARVLRPGVYAGYRIRRNAADPSLVDLTHGEDGASVLLSIEGVRIEEDNELAGIVKIQPADSMLSRYDLVVAEYVWSANNTVPQVYKVIRGAYQPDLVTEPVRPQAQSVYQLPLAWILVRPKTTLRGESRVEILQSDIFHAPKAADVEAPYEISTLKPELDPTNRKRIYVNEGIFPSSTGSSIVIFGGGYSSEIPDLSVDGEVRYFLFGISDDKEVSSSGESTTLLTIPEIGSDILPIGVAKASRHGTITTIDEIIDIRFPFSRRMVFGDEESFYREYLRESVFQNMQIDACDLDTKFDLTTLAPVDDNLTAEMNRGDTSLTVTWASSTPLATDVTVATGNILDGTDISAVRHILVLADSDVIGLTFDYSVVSPTSGFTGTYYDLGTIQEIQGGATSMLFLRFRILSSQFAAAGAKKIYSFAVCMNLSYATLNKNSLAGLGLEALGYQIENLIPNGDFFNWSRNDSVGATPDVASRNKISYTVHMADRAARTNIFAADGWQFTKMSFDPENGVISRILWSRDVIGSPDDNTIDTAMEWRGAGATTPAGENDLELRVPVYGQMIGQYITFAVDFKASHLGSVGIELRFYERTSDGRFLVQSKVRTGILRFDGTMLVKSENVLNEKVFAVGFVIVFAQLNPATTVYLKNARAAIGRYETLPFRRPPAADVLARAYYERGRLFAASQLRAGNDVGASLQFGSRKPVGMSENGALKTTIITSRCVNNSSPVFTVSAQGLAATSQAIMDGLSILDLDWEASVIYPDAVYS